MTLILRRQRVLVVETSLLHSLTGSGRVAPYPLFYFLTIPGVPHPLPLLQRVGFHNANTTACCSEGPNIIAAQNFWRSFCEARGIGSAGLKGYQSEPRILATIAVTSDSSVLTIPGR